MLVDTIKLTDNRILKIYQDSDTENPRTAWDNLGKMICFHRRYDLGDEHNISPDNYESFDDMIQDVVGDGVHLPLYLYDHGGITMSTGSFGCRWDSGQVGFIYMTKQDIIKEYGNDSKETREIVLKVLKGEVKTYDQYLTGDVYGFNLVELQKCNLGCEHEEIIDSCWGFYGSDHEASGLFEHAGIVKPSLENVLNRLGFI